MSSIVFLARAHNPPLKEICNDTESKLNVFNSWEGEARYKEGFKTTMDNINLAISICERLSNYCKTLMSII
jgi:hypothetical protein